MEVDRPLVFLGMIHHDIHAILLRLMLNIAGIYVGHGLLKPFRHIRYMFIAGACLSIAGFINNLMHQTTFWEWHLLVGSQTHSIPQLGIFTIEAHYLIFIAVYAITAMYVYLHKSYFWGHHDV